MYDFYTMAGIFKATSLLHSDNCYWTGKQPFWVDQLANNPFTLGVQTSSDFLKKSMNEEMTEAANDVRTARSLFSRYTCSCNSLHGIVEGRSHSRSTVSKRLVLSGFICILCVRTYLIVERLEWLRVTAEVKHQVWKIHHQTSKELHIQDSCLSFIFSKWHPMH